MRFGWFFIALVLGVSVLAACGDDGDEENGDALSKPEYIAQADAICKRANDEFDQLFETDFPVTQGALPSFFERAVAVFRKRGEDLRALEEPEADRAEIDRLLATGDKLVADFERAVEDPEFGAELFNAEGGENAEAFGEQAKAYGLKECGQEDEEDEEEEERVDTSGFSAEKRAYIREADAVCRETNKAFLELEGRYLDSFPPALEAWAEFLPAVVEVSRAGTVELERIDPPAADREQIEELVSRQEALIGDFEELGEIAARGDEAAFQERAPQVFASGDELDAEQRAYGFEECGQEEEGE